jgi:glutamate synthase domain-containing protein 2
MIPVSGCIQALECHANISSGVATTNPIYIKRLGARRNVRKLHVFKKETVKQQ